jgi:hypothetical protein
MLPVLSGCGGESPPKGTAEAPLEGGATENRPAAKPVTVDGYRAGPVADGGRISGTIRFAGKAPAPEPVAITKDKAVCGARRHTSETLVVGSDGGVRYAVVSIDPVPAGKPFDAGQRPTLDQQGCWFTPHVLLSPAGGAVDILNNDGILHNLHTFPNHNRPINVAQPKFRKRMTQSFALPDRVRVTCDVHAWMGAWIIVTAHPYYAVSAADGSYSLDDVPPGEYTVAVWHESLGTVERKVTVPPGGDIDASFSLGG